MPVGKPPDNSRSAPRHRPGLTRTFIEHNDRQSLRCGVDGGGEAGRPRTDDGDVIGRCCCPSSAPCPGRRPTSATAGFRKNPPSGQTISSNSSGSMPSRSTIARPSDRYKHRAQDGVGRCARKSPELQEIRASRDADQDRAGASILDRSTRRNMSAASTISPNSAEPIISARRWAGSKPGRAVHPTPAPRVPSRSRLRAPGRTD